MSEIVFLGMGGTIAGKAASSQDNVGYAAGQVSIGDILSGVAGLAIALGGCDPVVEQVAQLDSKDMDPSHWVVLAQRVVSHLARNEVTGVVVTHGTDTLEETAFFLANVLPPELLARKPVVLTCAMRPATAAYPDGPGNLVDATVVANEPDARGVLVVCAGSVHDAQHVQKVHPYQVNPFESGEPGPLGCVEEGRLRLFRAWPALTQRTKAIDLNALATASWPWVEIVLSHAGAQGYAVQAMLAAADGAPGSLRGLVVAGTGNGTIHQQLEEALLQAVTQGVRVVRTSRCAHGRVVLPAAVDTHSTDGISAMMLPPVKARIALMLEMLG